MEVTRFEPGYDYSNEVDFIITPEQDGKLINAGQYKIEIQGKYMNWITYQDELECEEIEDNFREMIDIDIFS